MKPSDGRSQCKRLDFVLAASLACAAGAGGSTAACAPELQSSPPASDEAPAGIGGNSGSAAHEGSGLAGGSSVGGAPGGSSGGGAGVATHTGGAAGTGATADVPPNDAGAESFEDPWDKGVPIPSYPQKPGDPAAGYEYLTSAGYFGCGIPQRFFGLVRPFATLPGISTEPLPGRNVTVDLAPLPCTWNLAKNEDGIDVVYMNCLQCHAGSFNGELIVGLGNADADWTVNLGDAAGAADLLGILLPTPQEKEELDKFIGRLRVIGGPAVMRTVGTNPAEMLATTFVSHRDRNTLAWSDTPLLSIPAIDNLPQGSTVISDTPPWWRMSKKNGQFYNGMGRGDHRRSMMLAGSLCTDSVPQAEAIDAHFNDVAAYISSIEPPEYPFAIDTQLADQGREIFNSVCAGCHGTYAPDPVTYPNLLIPMEEIQTDPIVGSGGTTKDYGADLVDWYNESWYGQTGPYEPYLGYIAPPLDAIWATAPYLHNGSVPDIATLLDSTTRPKYWRRVDHDTTHFDEDTLGFPWLELQSGQDAPPLGVAAKDIYDTEQYSHSNAGHTYGDSLLPEQRRAVIEYLKTL